MPVSWARVGATDPDAAREEITVSERDEWDEPDIDLPALDEPGQRLHFEDLHPVIQNAAEGAWSHEDYPGSVRDGWNALRDLLRIRLGRPQLDGVDLVNAIGESSPSLPLTDMATESDVNMHKGLVTMWRGVVWYVRNPEMHETTSPVEGDRIGAFERLALLSLCTRHVVEAGAPAWIDEAVHEAGQPLFPKTTAAAEELVATVSQRLHPEFATTLGEAAEEAFRAERTESLLGLAMVFRALVRERDDRTLTAAVSCCSRLIATDETTEVAGRLLTHQTFPRLAPRHQTKLAKFLANSLASGRIEMRRVRSAGGSLASTTRLIRAMSASDRAVITKAVSTLLQGTWQSQAFGTRVAFAIERFIAPAERDAIARLIALAVARDNAFGVVEEIETGWPNANTTFRVEIVGGLRDTLESARDEEMVEALIQRLEIEDAEAF